MTRPAIWCLIPLKRLEQAKQRLAPVLDANERAGLVRAMATDVIRAARATDALAGVAVVTGDASVATLARQEDAIVFAEPLDGGLNAALTRAAADLAGLGAQSVIILPGDVPQVRSEDIAVMIDGHGGVPAVTIARAETDGGSNALACTTPHAIPFAFGEDSFRRHCAAARGCGIEPRMEYLPRLARDIDRPADLATLLRQPSQTLSYNYLAALVPDRTAFVSRCSHEA